MPDQTEVDNVLGSRLALLTDTRRHLAWAPAAIGPKVDGTIRVGVLVPLTGKASHLGAETGAVLKWPCFSLAIRNWCF